MSLSKEQQRLSDEQEIQDRLQQVHDTLQNVKNSTEGVGEPKKYESLFEKVVRWWNVIKNFFKNLCKKVVDFFFKYSGFFAGVYNAFDGLAIASLLNHLHWFVRIGGSARSTIATIADRFSLNTLGNPTWWIRVDGPHPNTPFSHINVNPKLSGMPDPHIPLSGVEVQIAEIFTPILKFLSDIGPYLIALKIGIDVGRITWSGYKDYMNGSTRNTIETLLNILASAAGGIGGFTLGSALGTLIFPGIGTLLGALLIGMLGGIGLGIGSDFACDWILDRLKWDIDEIRCERCSQNFENRRYKEGVQTVCGTCRVAVVRYMSRDRCGIS